jgi:hypothetical protein
MDEAALPVGPIAWAQIIVIEHARNRSTGILTFASSHLYFSSFLYVGEGCLDLGLDLDAIDLEPIELSDREDGAYCGAGVPK